MTGITCTVFGFIQTQNRHFLKPKILNGIILIKYEKS